MMNPAFLRQPLHQYRVGSRLGIASIALLGGCVSGPTTPVATPTAREQSHTEGGNRAIGLYPRARYSAAEGCSEGQAAFELPYAESPQFTMVLYFMDPGTVTVCADVSALPEQKLFKGLSYCLQGLPGGLLRLADARLCAGGGGEGSGLGAAKRQRARSVGAQ